MLQSPRPPQGSVLPLMPALRDRSLPPRRIDIYLRMLETDILDKIRKGWDEHGARPGHTLWHAFEQLRTETERLKAEGWRVVDRSFIGPFVREESWNGQRVGGQPKKLFSIGPCGRHRGFAVIIFALAAMLCPAYSSPLAALGAASGVKNLRIPVGSDPSLPVATFTIGEIKFEKRQVGPFLLGVFQRPVFENVEVELKPRRSHEEWGYALRSFLEQTTSDKSILFRNFTLRTANGRRLLTSSEAAFDYVNGLISLTDVTFACGSGKDRSVPEAKLLLSDKEFSILVLRRDDDDERIKLVPQAP